MEQNSITIDECKRAYEHLVEKGYFTEKHTFDFYIDHRDKELIEVLHKMGYGGTLLALGYFYTGYSAFYYVIDVDRISMDDAKKIMDDYIKDWKNGNE